MVQRAAYLEPAMGPRLSLYSHQKADGNSMCVLEKLLDLSGAAEASSSFFAGFPTNHLTLQPHQQAQLSLSTGIRGLGLSSAEARRMSSPSKTQRRLGKLANRVRYERYVASLDQLPRRRPSEARAAHKERRRREAWPRPGNGVNGNQGLPLS